jgi:ubiquinone/menaquinone biosynthesis C-methylase UbiE
MKPQPGTGGKPRGEDINLRAGPQMQEYLAIVRRIEADAPRLVLDWGCGWGQVSDLLVQHGVSVRSFEYAADRPDGPQPLVRYPHLSAYISNDPRRLPYADGEFEAVLSCGVLEHVEDPDASLEEIKRVLEPGGTFYIYKLPNSASYLEAIARRIGWYYHGALPNERVYTKSSACDLVSRHGFVISESRMMNVLPLTISGSLTGRYAEQIWDINRRLSALPGLKRLATNIEIVASRR